MKITIVNEKKNAGINLSEGESLLAGLRRRGIYLPAYCGGRGTCGKCAFRLLKGNLKVTEADRKAFDKEQLNEGYRLACQAYPQADCTIELVASREEEFEILTSSQVDQRCPRQQENEQCYGHQMDEQSPRQHEGEKCFGQQKRNPSLGQHVGKECPTKQAGKQCIQSQSQEFGIAVDIGTTTLVLELVDLKSGQTKAVDSRVNHQRAYGADVISRIAAANAGENQVLQESICRDLFDGMRALLDQSGVPWRRICKIVIAGNTTMCHLLMGYSCKGLGKSPFTPVNIQTIRMDAAQLLDCIREEGEKEFPTCLADVEVVILPGVSVFIGADIVSGMVACRLDQKENPCMLIDLGTNGEMVVGTRYGYLASSAAAGPAFEGGNISCGMGSVKGAIDTVDWKEGVFTYTTIGNGEPVGLCGTGVLEAIAELLKSGRMDVTGLLSDPDFEEGVQIAQDALGHPICLKQEDIRQIQLAKAAVRACMEILMERYGIEVEDLETIYLSGGFGFRLNIEKAIYIGLLPSSFRGKVQVAGNTALAGAKACLVDESLLHIAAGLAAGTKEIRLASDPEFREVYFREINFDECT